MKISVTLPERYCQMCLIKMFLRHSFHFLSIPLRKEPSSSFSWRVWIHQKRLHPICPPADFHTQHKTSTTTNTKYAHLVSSIKNNKSSLYLDPFFLLSYALLTIILQFLLRGNLWQAIERMWEWEEVRKVLMVADNWWRAAASLLLDPAKGLLGQKRPALTWMMWRSPRWWTVSL